MENLKVVLAVACAVVVGWAFSASARSVSLSSDNGAIEVIVGADAEAVASTLYLAWGETDAGDALADWTNRVKVGDVTAVGGTFNIDGRALAIPSGAKIRAFVTEPGYELLEYIGSSGKQYVDTGIVGAFGDVYEVKFAVTAYTGGTSAMHILSEYDTSKGNDYGRYQVICRNASGQLGQGFESNGSNSSADPCIYADFKTSLNVFYTAVSDFTKGARAFEVYNADKTLLLESIGTTKVVHQTIYNPSGYTLYLFAANNGGTAAAMERGNTRVAYVKLMRGGSVVKHLVAARRGDSVGMVDLADGCRFYPNAGGGSFECGAVTGEIPGETLVASPTEDYSGFELPAGVVAVESDADGKVVVSVGADVVQSAGSLFLAWDETDRGGAVSDWAHRAYLGDVTASGGFVVTNGCDFAIPAGAKIRAFVTEPGYELLEYIGSSGTQYIDTGIVGALGDVYEVKLAVTAYTSSSSMHVLSEYDSSKGADYGRYQVVCRDSKGRLGQGFESNGSSASADPNLFADFVTSLNVFYTTVSDFTKGARAFEVYNADKTSLLKSAGTTKVVHQEVYNPNGYTLYLFAANNGGTAAAMERGNTRVAYVKLTRGGSVVKHLVAARRGDSVGMVDLADSCRFYPNAGDGSFECGTVVETLPGDGLASSAAVGYDGPEPPSPPPEEPEEPEDPEEAEWANLFPANVRHICVVAPCSQHPASTYLAAKAKLEEAGYTVTLSPEVTNGNGASEMTPAQKAEYFMRAWTNEDYDVIWAIRGGNGGAQTFAQLDPSVLRSREVPFLGFSNISCLLNPMEKLGVRQLISGPSLGALYSYHTPKASRDLICKLVGKEPISTNVQLTVQRAVAKTVTGKPLGGHWPSLSACNAADLPDCTGRIVFLEVNEYSYADATAKFDVLHGKWNLDDAAAIVVGEVLTTSQRAETLQYVVDHVTCPVYSGYPMGHQKEVEFFPVDFGRDMTLTPDGVITYEDLAPTGIPASAYIQDGLVAQWDGIENAGAGQPHDATLAEWKDASGTHSFVFNANSGITVEDSALVFPGSQSGYATLSAADTDATFEAAKNGTCEVVVLSDANTVANMALQSSAQSGICLFARARSSATAEAEILTTTGASDASKRTPVLCNLSSAITTMATTYSSALADDTWANGELLKKSGTGGYGTNPNDKTYLGHRASLVSGQSFKGRIYAIRLYSRPLTESEIAINANIDKIRFADANPAELTWPDGYRYNADLQVLEVLLALSGVDGATVGFDSEAFETATNGWFALGASVTAYAKPVAGQSITDWTGLPDGAQVSDGKTVATFSVNAPLTVAAVSHAPMTLRWRGGASALASDAANWVKDGGGAAATPQNGDAVYFDVDSPSMTWDLDEVTLASWTQTADYTGTVTFQTGISRKANGADKVAHGVLAEDGVTRVLKVTGDVTIDGGTWTHEANPAMTRTEECSTDGKGIWRLIADIGGNLTVGADAKIDVSAKGYYRTSGPGTNGGNSSAAHGSPGTRVSWSYSPTGADVMPVDSTKAPYQLGSASDGSAGGGAIILTVGGKTTLAGQMLANVPDKSGDRSGAGGTIYIKTGTIESTAESVISARSGKVSNWGPGGGGRIAVILTEPGATFDGFARDSVTAAGNSCSSSWQYTACGTVYLEMPSDEGNGELYLRGEDFVTAFGHGAMVLDPLERHFRRITMEKQGALAIPAGTTIEVDEGVFGLDAAQTQNRIFMQGGTLKCSADELVVSNVAFWVVQRQAGSNDYIVDGGWVDVKDGAGTLVLAKSTTTLDAPLSVRGSVRLADGAKMTHNALSVLQGKYSQSGTTCENIPDYTNRFQFAVTGSMTIPEGCSITATGCGFKANEGPGKPLVNGWAGSSHGGGVGGYGSQGARTVPEGSEPPCYGSIRRPITFGSGGSQNVGGGAIQLAVGGTLTLDGSIESLGYQGNTGGATSAAGSVWVTCGRLVSNNKTSKIRADAGRVGPSPYQGYYLTAASGGGRVAVWLTEPDADFTDFGTVYGRITAYGSTVNHNFIDGKTAKCTEYGAAGTVYLKTGAQAETEGTLVVANNKSEYHPSSTAIGPLVMDTEVGNVEIREHAVLGIEAGSSLTVSGDWSITPEATLLAEAGSEVVFTGSAASVISGTNEFCKFTCTTPGKTLKFDTNSLFTVKAGGTFTITGDEESKVLLRSTEDGVRWPMAFADGAVAAVEYADVQDSNNSGSTILATKSVGKESNNVGWNIIGEIVAGDNYWTGAAGSNWDTADNWSQGRGPVAGDTVIVTNMASGVYPVLSTAFEGERVEVRAGATLTVGGTLTLTEALTVKGVLNGTGTVALNGATADFTGGSIALGGTLSVAGAANVSLDLSGDTVGTLAFSRSGGMVTLPNGAAATVFTLAGSGSVVFGAGTTLAAREVKIDGELSGAQGISLSGADAGTWNLDATGIVRVNGVSVGGSNARVLPVFATTSVAVGVPNVNWSFNGAQRTWTGGAGTSDFATAENWSGSTVPGANDTVIIPSGATVVAAEKVEFYSLFMDGGTATFAQGFALGGGMDIASGATLQLDRPSSVAGSATFRSGSTLTHGANVTANLKAGETNSVDLTVGANLTIEADAVVKVAGKGFPGGVAPDWGAGSSVSGSGGSHGGHGSDAVSPNSSRPAYGSIKRPVMLGGGGASTAGGGAVKLTVAGTLRLDGMIDAEGGYYGGQYSGAGGSVWVTCGTLAGAGWIDVNGGRSTGSWSGGGGRAAVWQTVAADLTAFSGKVTAYGTFQVTSSTASTDGLVPKASCGTVYYHNFGEPEDGGTLVLDNLNGTRVGSAQYQDVELQAEFPPAAFGDEGEKPYANLTIVMRRGGALALTEDVKVADLLVDNPKASDLPGRVLTYGHVLTVTNPVHRKLRANTKLFQVTTYSRVWKRIDGKNSCDATDTELGGDVIWYRPGLLLFVR